MSINSFNVELDVLWTTSICYRRQLDDGVQWNTNVWQLIWHNTHKSCHCCLPIKLIKVLVTAQLTDLHNWISVQSSSNTDFSYAVTLLCNLLFFENGKVLFFNIHLLSTMANWHMTRSEVKETEFWEAGEMKQEMSPAWTTVSLHRTL